MESTPEWGDSAVRCRRCLAVRDETIRKRNRNNRQRGSSFERQVAKQLGGRRTGPLGGRDDVTTEMFSIQTKRQQRFSLIEARAYLGDLRRTYPTRIPLVVHALPGERGGVVIIDLQDWVDLHGPEGTKEAA